MRKKTVLNENQVTILDRIAQSDFLSKTFYFTGGTALSEVYLHHRESVDLDFFAPHAYNSQNILTRLSKWSKELHFVIESEYVEPTHIYFLTFQDDSRLKIDFAHYPYQQLQSVKTCKEKLQIDSLFDIAANKLLALTQRAEVKDFVDVYFLLQKFTFWDLKDAVKKKFNVTIEPFVFASDCMVVDEFEFLPKMIVPFELSQLQEFYKELAKKLAGKSIK